MHAGLGVNDAWRLSTRHGLLSDMTDMGVYGDGRTFALPDGWRSVGDEVLGTALTQVHAAMQRERVIDNAGRYYNRDSPYSGTLFLDVLPNEPFSIEAADLYAVTTLSMDLDARHGRLLLDDGEVRSGVCRQLRSLDPDLPLSDVDNGVGGSAETLTLMYELHGRFRDLLPGASRRWVTAAKLCARKRPRLFPVRDNLVCVYLSAGRPLRSGDGWPGDFSIDLQIYAFLITHPDVKAGLSWVRGELDGHINVRVDVEDLRLLDALLWMAAKQ